MANPSPSSGETPEMHQFNLALEFHRRGNLISAKEIYARLLVSHPENAEVLHLLGVIALQTKDYEKAIGLISKALVINPQMPNAFSNLGNVYKEQKQIDKALKCYQCALKIDPLFADAFSNIGNIYYDQGKYAEAMNFYNRTVEINAEHADAYYNRGNVFLNFGKNSAAVSDYSKALALDPSIVDAYLNRGQAHKKVGNYPAALADFSRVIEMQPQYAEAYYHRAVTYFADNNHTLTALEDLKKAAQLKPDLDYLLSAIFFHKKAFADWDDLEVSGNQLLQTSMLGKRAITPFALISHFDSLRQQLVVTQSWINTQIKKDEGGLPLPPKIPRKEKIHLGYFSSDFNEHPVTYASAGLFRHHDKSKFKITGFYFGRKKDATVESLSKTFDEFYDIADLTDVEVTELARKLKIDIAIDMNGCTSGSRPAVFLNQAAPTQVNYLGYPGTMGTLLMDYIIADEVVIPPESRKYYTEKIAYLDCFMPHDDKLKVSDKKFTRTELGLPEEGFIFCGFNNSYKITSQVWDVWMNILKAVPKSTLWLSYRNDPTSDNLRKEAKARGVDANRIIFAPRMDDVREHLARLQCADLLLDTYPYNAHTTASAALWAGLPVLTRAGESFASRVAASLLSTCQMPELIVRTPEEYQALAIDLANNPQKIAAFKKRLSDYRDSNPLFNSKNYTRKLENLFCQMYERSQSGLIPENLKYQNEQRN
jgi:predicted O-linked N-acetylglucosamine transferase (SPINDLY family)